MIAKSFQIEDRSLRLHAPAVVFVPWRMLASEMERLEWHRDSKEKASRPLWAAGPLLPSLFYRTRPSAEEGWMSDSASALAEARKSSIHLAGWSGTRAPKRPSRQILDR